MRLPAGRWVRLEGRSVLGQGQVIDIAHTNDLLPGDQIRIEFPFGSVGWVGFGPSETFTVFGVDKSTGQVGVYEESGKENYFDGGSKAELLAKLQEKTSYSSITITRIPGTAPTPMVSAGEKQLIDAAIALGLPKGYGPCGTTVWRDVDSGDYIVSIAEAGGGRRLWKAYDDDQDWIHIKLTATDYSTDQVGETNKVLKDSYVSSTNEMVFCGGYSMPGEKKSVARPVIRAEEETNWLLIGGAALGIGVLVAFLG